LDPLLLSFGIQKIVVATLVPNFEALSKSSLQLIAVLCVKSSRF